MMSKTLVEKRDDSHAEETMSTWELLQQPGVSKALFTFGYTMMLALANTAGEPEHCWIRNVCNCITDHEPQYCPYSCLPVSISEALDSLHRGSLTFSLLWLQVKVFGR